MPTDKAQAIAELRRVREAFVLAELSPKRRAFVEGELEKLTDEERLAYIDRNLANPAERG